MPNDELNALRRQLGGTVPDGLRQLSAKELRDLSDAVSGARRRQAKAVAEAGERALGHIPRLLRGPVRKIVG